MKCIVTAGPTYEPLDEVRRLTNFSTGRLGSGLADFLAARGHEVTLLLGYYATWRGAQKAQRTVTFTTTANLRDHLQELAAPDVGAVFHAAAVSDFGFGRVLHRAEDGQLTEVKAGKHSTRTGGLLAELVATPKIIAGLRQLYPRALLVGWKYEVDGGREDVLARAWQQIAECRTDACVANGRAYGEGFGVVTTEQYRHCLDRADLFAALAERLKG
jgi:phosphopantothenoylcysteine decarboxylase/phosphopantothenate--cysteine ligase